MATQVATLSVLGKRKTSTARAGSVRLVGATPEPSSEAEHSELEPGPSAPKSRASSAKPILINGKLSTATQRRYQCTFEGCEKTYAKPSRLAEHERSHTGDRPFVCDTCQKAYLRESHLHAHARSHLPSEARPFICTVEGCGKRFWTSQHLKTHDDWHNGAKRFPCTEDGCSETFTKHHQLRNHICETHAPPGTKPYICDHEGCTQSFKMNQHLKAHKKTHDPERYTCVHLTCLSKVDEALTYFPTWSALQHHIRTEHPPTCNHPTCKGRTFASQKGFKAHMKIHEDRELEAELCTHMESDAEENTEPPAKKLRRGGEVGRDWKCDFDGCDKDFKSKKALTNHRNVTHLGQRAFVCSLCEKTFGYKHLLQRHAAKVHAKDNSGSDDEDDDPPSEADRKMDDVTSHIDSITGKAYAIQAEANITSGRASHCPFPDLGDLVHSPTLPMSQPCLYVYSRVYDLRRHLDSTHGIQVEKQDLHRWLSVRHPSSKKNLNLTK